MKIPKNDKYKTAAIYASLALCSAVLLYLTLTNIGVISGAVRAALSVLSPIVYGFIFAYVLSPLMNLYERTLFRFKKREKLGKKLRRPLALMLTVTSVIFLITLFFIIVLPQIAASYEDLESQIGYYVTAAQNFADSLVRDFPIFNGKYESLAELIDVNDLTSDVKRLISSSYTILESTANYILSYAGDIVVELKNVVMGLIISVYFLYSKERLCGGIKKMLRSIFSEERYTSILRLGDYTDKTFGGFLTGKIIDSAIIGVLTFIVLSVFSFPFTPLISVIIGVTNIIPFFGPFIGAIPSAFIIFIASPEKTIWFLIIILVIQQLDGNVIGPKIIGNTTGMSSLAVLISITVAGGLFGIPGMIFGVPAGAVICAVVKALIERRLKKQNAPIDIEYFLSDANSGKAESVSPSDRSEAIAKNNDERVETDEKNTEE